MTVPAAWNTDFTAVVERIGPRFARAEARRHAADYLRGLLGRVERKNGWQLAEAVGDATPYGLQQFLYRAMWDPDAVRDDLRAYVVEHLGDPGGVLVVDETGFLKKGDKSAGVQPQYSGAAGRTANAQIGVFLTYAGARGHTFLDRALYLPASWTDDRGRCRAAGIPDDVAFATKPALAQAMLGRALDAGVPAAWVTADSIYGDVKYLRVWLEARPIGYVLAVSRKDTVWGPDWRQRRIGTYLADPPAAGWERASAGAGAKGPRDYDWLRLPLVAPLVDGWARWVLLRRSVADPTDVTAYVCFAPDDAMLADLVRVAGSRWTVEICFEAAKQEVGLAEYEVRSWTGWHRHVTLACLAHAFLTVVRAHDVDPLSAGLKGGPTTGGLARFKASRRAISSP
jgi:SRSO17 transposase